jgi:hypothetical protein
MNGCSEHHGKHRDQHGRKMRVTAVLRIMPFLCDVEILPIYVCRLMVIFSAFYLKFGLLQENFSVFWGTGVGLHLGQV